MPSLEHFEIDYTKRRFCPPCPTIHRSQNYPATNKRSVNLEGQFRHPLPIAQRVVANRG